MKTRPLTIAILFLCAILNTYIFAQANSKVHEIDRLMAYSQARGFFNGTILVAENQQIIYKKAFGYADLENAVPLQTAQRFYLGSVSKQFTAMAIMILKEKGLLGYDDRLLKYFPDFPSYASDVTICHLLTHTSGIPDYFGLGIYKAGLRNQDVFDALVKQKALDFAPGEKWQYSNSGYALLSMIIEKVSGLSYAAFLSENIFEPLGLENTFVYDESKPVIDKRAIGYDKKGRKDDYNIYTTGAGGIFSTIDDLFKWDQSLYKPALVSKETLMEAYTPFKLNNDSLSYYGFGWMISDSGSVDRYWHTGSLAGFRTYLERDVTNKNSIIFLTNMGDAVKRKSIYLALRNILDDKEYKLPQEDPFNVRQYINYAKYNEANMNITSNDTSHRVVFMGNSITEAWERLHADFFKNENYINRGISGQVTQQMLLRFRTDVIDLNPKVVVILAGTNDIAQNNGFVPIDEIAQNIMSMAELAEDHGIKVILCSVLPAIDYPWRPGLQPAEKIIKLNEILKSYAAKKKFVYVDYYTDMVDDRGGLKVPDYTAATDLVHPNRDGYRVMEKLIQPAIEKALNQ